MLRSGIKNLFTIILFFYCTVVVAKENTIKEDIQKALELLDNDQDECILFTQKVLEHSKTINDHYGLVKSNYILGYIYKAKGDFGKSVIYYLESIRFAREAKYENSIKDLLDLLQNTGTIFKKFENFSLAKEYYHDAMDISLEMQDIERYSRLIHLTARILKEEKDYDNAVKLLESTFDYFPHISKSTIANIYNQLALTRKEQKIYTEALLIFDKLLAFTREDDQLSAKYHSWTYHNIGSLYSELNQYDSAIIYYNKAIEYKKHQNRPARSVFLSLKDLGEAYVTTGKYQLAEPILDEAISLIEKSRSVEKFYEVYKFASVVKKEKGDIAGYITHQNSYSSSLENFLADQRQTEVLDKKYNLDLITQRYFALVAEQNRNQQIQYYSTVGGSFLVTLIVLIIAFYQYRRYRLRKDLEASLKPYIKNAL